MTVPAPEIGVSHRTAADDWRDLGNLASLCVRAGIAPGRLRRLVVKELVDNALDAGGRCELSEPADGTFQVRDFGPGFQGGDTDVAARFSLAGRPAWSRHVRLPRRGLFGLGLPVVAGAVLASAGAIEVATRGRRLRLIPRADGSTDVERLAGTGEPGTRVTVRLGDAAPADPQALLWGQLAIAFAAGESGYKGGTAPSWYDEASFGQLLGASGEKTVRELVASLDGCSGTNTRRIAGGYQRRKAASLSRTEGARLLAAAQVLARPVSPDRLGQVGRTLSPTSPYKRIQDFLPAPAGAPQIPFVLEAWAIADQEDRLVVLVNRTPAPIEFRASRRQGLLYFAGPQGTIDLLQGRSPATLFIDVLTPYLPGAVGAVPDLTTVMPIIRQALQAVLRPY